MNANLTEQKVLKKLDIEDFRHLTKDKVINMASLLDKMDPEVAKKALEQFPDFSNTMKSIINEYKDFFNNGLADNSESVKSFYASCDQLINTCQELLEKDEPSLEEKKEILSYMLQIVQMKGTKDSENKRFIVTMSVIGMVAIGVAARALVVALGGKVDANMDDIV